MISREDFAALEAGDLIVWRKKYLRTVLRGPRPPVRPTSPLAIVLPIRHLSWTGRPYTVYSYTDVRDKISKADAAIEGLLLDSERELLKSMGFVRLRTFKDIREVRIA